MTYPGPTLAGFIAFLRNVAGINSTILPDSAPVIDMAYCVALEIVNQQLLQASPLIYDLAVYNLATDNLIRFAQDTPPSTFFADLRQKFGVFQFTAGVVSSASDNGTSSNLEIIEAAKNFTLGNLQNLKTPFGRQYLAFAQDAGTLWGVS